MSSRYLNPTTPGALLSSVQGIMTAGESLVLQAITSGTYFIWDEAPTDAVDGVNTLFNTLNKYQSGTVRVYLNGARQKPGLDYVESPSNQQITFTIAPLTNDVILFDYEVLIAGGGGGGGDNGLLLQDGTNLILQDSTDLIFQT